MKDMILAKKAELKKRGYKGFTLMEMLIVVAIIAVLVAIAIPVFTSQLEKSRDAVTTANLRAAYSEAMAEMVSNSTSTSSAYKVACKRTQADTDLSGTATELPFSGDAVTTIAGYTSAKTVNVTFNIAADNTVTATIAA
jgi:type IV pilus assembly protein PilA